MPTIAARAGTLVVRGLDLLLVAGSVAIAYYLLGLSGESIATVLTGDSWAGTWGLAWFVAAVASVGARLVRANRARRHGADWADRLPSAWFGLVLLASSILVLVVGALALINNSGDDVEQAGASLGYTELLGQLRSLAILLIVLAWVLLQTNYAERYARIHVVESGSDAASRSLVFPGTEDPTFSDFFYFAITVGVSFATPDVEVRSSRVRSMITVHVMLSFVYSTVILAALVGVLTA